MKNILLFSMLSLVVFLFFINCGNLNAQKSVNSSLASATSQPPPTSISQANVPVDPMNPYILNCIVDSDGTKVSTKLLSSTVPSSSVSSKIGSLDWNQDTDLVVAVDNECLRRAGGIDPVMSYLNPLEATPELNRSIYVVKKESVQNLNAFIADALASECLVAAEKNEVFKVNALDPAFPIQRHLASIGATQIFLDGLPTGTNIDVVKVAVIDTGVETSNPDLTNQFARDGAGNIIGKNSTSTPSDGFLTDSGFHGTHVAGLISAEYSNGVGGSGVYGKNIKLYPVRASQDGDSLTLAALASAINWSVSQGVDVINMSVGAPSDNSLTLKDAISNAIAANVVIVVAAGNDNKELGLAGSMQKVYPALYGAQFNGLITVGSIDATTGLRSWFSNYSSTNVDILAPGSDGTNGIVSTVPTSINPNGYAGKRSVSGVLREIEGTSMSAPIVSGAIAAAISITKHRFKNSAIEDMLKGPGSPDNPNLKSFAVSGNYLNLPVFLNYVKIQVNGTAPPPPPGSITISSQPVNRIAVAGESISLRVTAVIPNGGTASYQWLKNGVAIGSNSPMLSLNGLTVADAGSYKVIVSSGTLAPLTSQSADLKIALAYCE